MKELPQHKVSGFSETGIYLRIFLPDVSQDTSVMYVHQDDYRIVICTYGFKRAEDTYWGILYYQTGVLFGVLGL